jgi:polysaccharide biosynthesis protein PelA
MATRSALPSRIAILTWGIMVFLTACLGFGAPVHANEVQRTILAIYDSAHEEASSSTVIHYRAEFPLNHLGYIVDYLDLRTQELPDAEEMRRYRAVMTWFTYDLDRPTAFLEWAAKTAEGGTPFIMLGAVGGRMSEVNLRLLNRVLAPMGVRLTTRYVNVTAGTHILRLDGSLIGFERPLDPLLPDYPIIERVSDASHIALEVIAPAGSGSLSSALVVVGEHGAFVPGGFDVYYDAVLERSQWIVNPFELFRRALGEDVFPIPDTTTVSGRRLYFSHVDGDGWNNIAEMDRYQRPPIASGEVMLRELIAPFPDLPVSVGLVAGDLDPMLGGGERAAEIARRIYALPQVEVASHTHTHPFEWGFYEHYNRQAELALLPAPKKPPADDGLTSKISIALGLSKPQSEADLARARYMSGGLTLPRAYLRDPFGLGTEVGHAVRETEALAPAGKQVALYQWSGDTRAFEAIIRATRRAGLRNINGGDTRFDDEYPSVGYVAPLSRVAGKERQIYAVNSNENTYTNEWTDHYHGYLSLAETLRRTEHPRRLKGMNIYYHTFSAEKEASLGAVRTHLEWARNAPLAPIRASRYAAIADGFFSSRIEALGGDTWRISNRDALQTVRFDDAQERDVDLAGSTGVIGRTWHEGSLYVALDEAVPEAIVRLRPRAASRAASTREPLLEGSRWLVWGLKRPGCGISHAASGYGKGDFVWDGMAPGARYLVEAQKGDDVVWSSTAIADDEGRLAFVVNAGAIEALDIKISCQTVGEGA